jgi:hypothetical protein
LYGRSVDLCRKLFLLVCFLQQGTGRPLKNTSSSTFVPYL